MSPTNYYYITSTRTLYIIDVDRIRVVQVPVNEWDGEWKVTTLGRWRAMTWRAVLVLLLLLLLHASHI